MRPRTDAVLTRPVAAKTGLYAIRSRCTDADDSYKLHMVPGEHARTQGAANGRRDTVNTPMQRRAR